MLNVDYWCLMSRDRAGLRQCRHLRFLISFGDKIRPLAIFFWRQHFIYQKLLRTAVNQRRR
jgi:hypothetical protein